MPKNAYFQTDDLPLELQLDLLVDGELTESRRRELLRRIESQPAEWRTLAIRFLQQQTEKQSAKALMNGGRLIPVEVIAPERHRKPIIDRVGWYRITGVAAGLFIAASSALVTLALVNRNAPPASPSPTQVAQVAEFQTNLPADVVDTPAALPVRVPVVQVSNVTPMFPAADSSRPGKTSFVVEPSGKDAFMVIPVSTSKLPVY